MNGVPAWVADYVGLPFVARGRDRDGCDCYGLVRIVLKDRAGADLPAFGGCGQTDNKGRQARVIERGREAIGWKTIPGGMEQPLDVVLVDEVYRDGFGAFQSAPLHMGIVVVPGWMLHTKSATGSRVERYSKMPIGAVSFYRHG